MIPYLFLLCGPAGVGKSTWLKNKFSENWDKTHSAIVSRDEIRFHLLEKEGLTKKDYFKKEKETEVIFYSTIAAALDAGDDVYADATHLTKKSRAKTIREVTKYSKNKKFAVICLDFWCENMRDICYIRNHGRTGLALVPDEVVIKQCEIYERPTKNEDKIDLVFRIEEEKNE